MRKRDMCAFCPEKSDMTLEHIWDAWVGEALGPKKYTMMRKESDGTILKWPSSKLAWKTRVVCGKCNNTWMSELVNKTKTIAKDMILEGHDTTLREADIATISAYAFMKSIVADHPHENRESFFTFSERQSFRRTLSIPAGVQMWLATLPVQHGVFKSMTVEAPLGMPNRFELNIFTYCIGHLVIQVAGCRWKKKALRRHARPPVLTQGPEWDSCSISFWPGRLKSVTWPPAMILSRDLIDTFVERWISVKRGW
jgi:hypothetical protein